jgi:hypothetical protein
MQSSNEEKLLKILEIKKEELNLLDNINDDIIKLIFPIDGKLITKEQYDKIFVPKNINEKSELQNSVEKNVKEKENMKINKKRTYEEMNNSNNSIKDTKSLNNPQANFKAKKFKAANPNNLNITSINSTNSTNLNNIQDPMKKIYSGWSDKKLEDEILKLKKNIKDIEEEENKSSKTDKEILKFEELYNKWLKISQDAVYTILEMFPQNQNYERNTIKSLIEHFKIDPELIKYDEENDEFKE